MLTIIAIGRDDSHYVLNGRVLYNIMLCIQSDLDTAKRRRIRLACSNDRLWSRRTILILFRGAVPFNVSNRQLIHAFDAFHQFHKHTRSRRPNELYPQPKIAFNPSALTAQVDAIDHITMVRFVGSIISIMFNCRPYMHVRKTSFQTFFCETLYLCRYTVILYYTRQ